MNNLGLTVTVNKYITSFQSNTKTFVCDSLDNIKNELIKFIADQFNHFNIDFPIDYCDFEYHCFDSQPVKADAINYSVFNNNSWSSPWSLQEIYLDVLDYLQEKDNSCPPNFSEIYGEPNPDEEQPDDFKFENSEHVATFENKLNEAIDKSKSGNKEDELPACECNKCKEGEVYQKNKNDSINL